jgi:hypothetical protein
MKENKSSNMDFGKMLAKSPTRDNWSKVPTFLKMEGAKYYEVMYSKGGIKDSNDLAKSSVRVWNSRNRLICEFPLFVKDKGNFEGALHFFKDLVQKPRKI